MLKTLIQPTRWSCGPTALAMILEVPVENVLTIIGHDGSRVAWPDLPDPRRRIGFHEQELIDCALAFNHALVTFQTVPLSIEEEGGEERRVWNDEYQEHRIEQILSGRRGLLLGYTNPLQRHYWAFDGHFAYDPTDGSKVDFFNGDHGIHITTFLMLVPFQNQIFFLKNSPEYYVDTDSPIG